MADWYVYHSEEIMGYRYGHPQQKHVFSTKDRDKELSLGTNINIWVIEGVGQSPKDFYLAAHFTYEEAKKSPFPEPYEGEKYSKFAKMYVGPGESYGSKYNLTIASHPWFEVLHKKYITKQKFFNEIIKKEIVDGLNRLIQF
jgi:hypothetical protein